MEDVVIKCKGISKHYGEGENRVDALKDINIEILQDNLTLLVGPSGSGKTTLLSILTTILTPDKGELIILGHDVHLMSEDEKAHFRNKNLGVVFQSLFLIPTLTVAENVSLPLIIAGGNKAAAEKKAIDLLEQLHIGKKAHVSPANLSKGQQQRVAIARAMISDAKILVCDEPTSALDQVSGSEVMGLLQHLSKTSGRAVLVVTHDHRTFTYANRVITLSDGQITPG
jgi:putative ABC transport system ATP-binding protein